MAHSYHHALSSAKRYGGKPEDYLPIHTWFDASKAHWADAQHRALRHHTMGIFEAEQVFGATITNSSGDKVPVRFIGEQHCLEDFGFIPTVSHWLRHIPLEEWMRKGAAKFSREFDVKGAENAVNQQAGSSSSTEKSN